MQQGGVIMWNWGMHCNRPGCVTEHVQEMFSTFVQWMKTEMAFYDWDIVWRETEPQHFNTTGGIYVPTGVSRVGTACVNQAVLDNFRNEEASAAIVQNVGYPIPVISLFDMLSSRAGFHSDTSGDCTHYVYTPWRFGLTWTGLLWSLTELWKMKAA
jgi:hypothetical protein